jgi:hypothetical protein
MAGRHAGRSRDATRCAKARTCWLLPVIAILGCTRNSQRPRIEADPSLASVTSASAPSPVASAKLAADGALESDLPHTEHFNCWPSVGYCRVDEVTDAVRAVIESIPKHEELQYRGSDVDDARLATFGKLPWIRDLDIGLRGPVDLAPLGRMVGLRRLELRGGVVTSLGALHALGHLERLQIAEVSVTAEHDLRSLPPSLTELRILRCPGVTDLAHGADVIALERLDLSHVPMSTLAGIAGLPHLSSLTIYDATNLATIEAIATLPALDLVDITTAPKLLDLRPLGRSKSLTSVFLNEVDVRNLSFAPKMPALTALSISNAPALTTLDPLRAAAGLSSLGLFRLPLGDLEPLAALPRLGSLTMGELPITTVAPLESNRSLRRITFTGETGGPADLAPLADITTLHSITLPCKFDRVASAAFQKLRPTVKVEFDCVHHEP